MDPERIEELLRSAPPDEGRYRGDIASILADPGAHHEQMVAPVRRQRSRPIVAAAWLAVAAASITGIIVVARRDSTPSTPSPTPDVLVDRWVGPPRDLADVNTFGTFTVLDIRNGALQFGSGKPGGAIAYGSTVRQASGQRLVVTSTATGHGCRENDRGVYTWSVSPGGTHLDLEVVSDACAARTAAIAGTWTHTGCRAATEDCLGVVEAGTYRSTNFDPHGTGAYGQLTVDLPDGWANTADFATNYFLRPASDYLSTVGNGDVESVSGVYVWGDVAAAVQNTTCDEEPDSKVAVSAKDIAASFRRLGGVVATDAGTTTVDGHTALMLDLSLDPAWTGTCPFVVGGTPFVNLLTQSPTSAEHWSWGLETGEHARVLLFDLAPAHTAAIFISSNHGTLDELLPSALAIVRSFTFS